MVLLSLIALTALAEQPAPLPACVGVKTESRYAAYGYNHIVTLTSGCSQPASCTVATDVNPTPQTIELPSKSTIEVTTFLGAAASTFTAKVTCKLR